MYKGASEFGLLDVNVLSDHMGKPEVGKGDVSVDGGG